MKQKINLDEGRSYFHAFESLEELVALRPTEKNKSTFDSYSRSCENKSWTGIIGGIKGLEDALAKGWPEGAEKLNSVSANDIEDTIPVLDVKRRKVRSDQGDELDIHQVYAGNLSQAWIRRGRRAHYTIPIITIAVQIGAKNSNSPDELFWRGAAALKLSDKLEKAGYSVNIIAVSSSYGLCSSGDMKSVFGFTYKIKDSKMQLDMGSLAAVACLAGFMRYFMFRAMASASVRIGSNFGTYDNDSYQTKLAAHTLELHGYEDAYLIPADIYSKSEAEAYIHKTVAQINKPKEFSEAA